MTRLGLTPRQRDALDFVERHVAEHGFAPSYRELAVGVGLRSPSGVHRLVQGLVERGHLTAGVNRARSLALVREPGWEARR